MLPYVLAAMWNVSVLDIESTLRTVVTAVVSVRTGHKSGDRGTLVLLLLKCCCLPKLHNVFPDRTQSKSCLPVSAPVPCLQDPTVDKKVQKARARGIVKLGKIFQSVRAHTQYRTRKSPSPVSPRHTPPPAKQ